MGTKTLGEKKRKRFFFFLNVFSFVDFFDFLVENCVSLPLANWSEMMIIYTRKRP